MKAELTVEIKCPSEDMVHSISIFLEKNYLKDHWDWIVDSINGDLGNLQNDHDFKQEVLNLKRKEKEETIHDQ